MRNLDNSYSWRPARAAAREKRRKFVVFVRQRKVCECWRRRRRHRRQSSHAPARLLCTGVSEYQLNWTTGLTQNPDTLCRQRCPAGPLHSPSLRSHQHQHTGTLTLLRIQLPATTTTTTTITNTSTTTNVVSINANWFDDFSKQHQRIFRKIINFPCPFTFAYFICFKQRRRKMTRSVTCFSRYTVGVVEKSRFVYRRWFWKMTF